MVAIRPKQLRGPQRRIKRTRSAAQVKRNNAFRACCTYWRKNLSVNQKFQWELAGPFPLTAFNYFLSLNLDRQVNDLDIIEDPPED